MIIIHAAMTVKEDKQDEFLQEVQQLVEDTKKEAGNITYQLLKNTSETNVYTMVEVWKDMEAVASHNKSEHFVGFTQKARDFLAAPLQVDIYDGKKVQQ
ncbi:putative quinol monooxygenase [Niallia nealsonii]|uniref:Antibiotic biosynthesis monooxygenase n=1 Tax=Niallia nealsonii TaxID=115979 RepID=A0A2N0Z5T9_9BACI|nr:putative quinol monooxygenase [Niallia nealsonii]PKG24854.1 antibiotic biosynthesis monooxygenase [Niallia nealsonii]